MSCHCATINREKCCHIVGIYLDSSTLEIKGTLIKAIDLRLYMEERLECGITFFRFCPKCGAEIDPPVNCRHQEVKG